MTLITDEPTTTQGPLSHAYIYLADDEWGSELMGQVAEETFAQHSDVEVVTVYEHGGWFLTYCLRGGELLIVDSANDQAVFEHPKSTIRDEIRRRGTVRSSHSERRKSAGDTLSGKDS